MLYIFKNFFKKCLQISINISRVKFSMLKNMSELEVIKTKFQKIDSRRWWGDDFDVRFFLVNILKKIERATVLDIGGGVGIILSETSKNNLKEIGRAHV